MVQLSRFGRFGCWNTHPGGGEGARLVEVAGPGVGVPPQAAEVVHTAQALPSPGMSQETCGEKQEICGQAPIGCVGVGWVPMQFLIICSREV